MYFKKRSIPDVIKILHLLSPSCRPLTPGVDSASNINEYQEYFLGSKGGRWAWLITLPPSCVDDLGIW